MHFYFMGHPKAMWREVTTTDHATAVLEPWEQRLRELGVEITFNHWCQGVRFEDNRVVGEVGDDTQYDGVILACSIPGIQAIVNQSENRDEGTPSGDQFKALCTRLNELKVAPPQILNSYYFDTYQ